MAIALGEVAHVCHSFFEKTIFSQSSVRLESFMVWGIRAMIPSKIVLLIRIHLLLKGCRMLNSRIFHFLQNSSCQILPARFCPNLLWSRSMRSIEILFVIWIHSFQGSVGNLFPNLISNVFFKNQCQKLAGHKRWNWCVVSCIIYTTKEKPQYCQNYWVHLLQISFICPSQTLILNLPLWTTCVDIWGNTHCLPIRVGRSRDMVTVKCNIGPDKL